MTVVAIIAQGAMGAGMAHRLTSHGATVLTSLAGRSPASARRAAAAGMRVPLEHRHPKAAVPQPHGGGEAAEPGAHDHHLAGRGTSALPRGVGSGRPGGGRGRHQ